MAGAFDYSAFVPKCRDPNTGFFETDRWLQTGEPQSVANGALIFPVREVSTGRNMYVNQADLETEVHRFMNSVIDTFRKIDSDGGGSIDSKELLAALDKNFPQQRFTLQVAQTLVNAYDDSKNGTIEFTEFFALYRRLVSITNVFNVLAQASQRQPAPPSPGQVAAPIPTGLNFGGGPRAGGGQAPGQVIVGFMGLAGGAKPQTLSAEEFKQAIRSIPFSSKHFGKVLFDGFDPIMKAVVESALPEHRDVRGQLVQAVADIPFHELVRVVAEIDMLMTFYDMSREDPKALEHPLNWVLLFFKTRAGTWR
jgi:EF-hand domain pair